MVDAPSDEPRVIHKRPAAATSRGKTPVSKQTPQTRPANNEAPQEEQEGDGVDEDEDENGDGDGRRAPVVRSMAPK